MVNPDKINYKALAADGQIYEYSLNAHMSEDAAYEYIRTWNSLTPNPSRLVKIWRS